ncbi:hypothetical protein R1sor_019824 [Riccia sorocarpa]|uniref:Uncharacterized protein n=1 Tax=Riccia sorocarpa TaxID=122646 RepID=A0ABD3IHZ0_9MARC
MASNPKLDTSSSSPDGVPYGSQRSNHSNISNLERSGNTRESHEGRMLVLGAAGAGGAVNSSGAGAGSASELPPLSQVLCLGPLTLGDQRGSRHLELKRATNAALGPLASEDPQLGSLQSKPLETFGPDELKRLRSSLLERGKSARDRSRQFAEAILKLDRFRNQSRKRSRPDPSNISLSQPASTERSLSSVGVGERPVASVHNMKGNSSTPNTHGGGGPDSAKGGDRNKPSAPNKRVRTSMADTRPDGRPSGMNPQRPSVLTERDRDASRPSSSSLTSPSEEKERSAVPPSEGWEKSKMKGRRSGIKLDASVASLANGASEGDREHKWSGQQHRVNAESRSRPSEGHGFRSGPVHGITSVHKSESSAAQLNGVSSRGTNKSERDVSHGRELPEKPEPAPKVDRSVKDHPKPSSVRDDSHPANPPGLTKAKAARAPRSSSGAGGVPAHLSRNSSFGENRDRHAPPTKMQPQVPAQVPVAPPNRKRPAPSRSSSPPAQWAVQRPQKMARIARRVNHMPGAVAARDEQTATVNDSPVNRDNGGPSVGARPSTGMASGSGVARRVSVSTTHAHPQTKSKVTERVTASVGLSESDESEDEAEKVKEKPKKQGDWEQKPTPLNSQKLGSSAAPAKKARVASKEEGAGDGVRRQGRSGRGAVGPRTNVVSPVVEKVEASGNAKQLRSVRVGPEKHERPGRPPTKKDSASDRKPLTRPRRPVGNGVSEVSGESDDDREELVNAVNKAINASGLACSNIFWKQMEPYFAHLTPADMQTLRELSKDLEEGDSALRIPPFGELSAKIELQRNISPPVSPGTDSAGGRSLSVSNGSIDLDGVRSAQSYKDKADLGKVGVGCQWYERVLPLSQRLLSALIAENDVDEFRREESDFYDDPHYERRDQSPLGPGSTSESEHGDSDSEPVRTVSDRWTMGGREGLPNGHSDRSAELSMVREELVGDDEDILWNPENKMRPVVKQEAGDDGTMISGVNKEERGSRSSSSNLTAWELHYQRMTVDERIVIELQSVGINIEPVTDPAQREDDEICEELRKLQRELADQVAVNKYRLYNLEKKILEQKVKEDMDRERLAMDKLVEIAYNKRMGNRGSSGGKSSASKGAKAAGLAMVKRLLARVRAHEAGNPCLDGALRDLLLGSATKEIESSAVLGGGAETVTPSAPNLTAALSSETAATVASPQPSKVAAPFVSEGPGGRSAVRKTEVKSEKDIASETRQQTITSTTERNKGKEEGWPSRAKEREVYLEDVSGSSVMRDVNAIGATVLGGTKGKRSERERDGKSHGKESQARSESAKRARQTDTVNAKPERKTKTKPRQKTAPLTKAVNGLLAKPAGESSKDKCAIPSPQLFVPHVKPKEEVVSAPPTVVSQSILPDPEEPVDLSNIPLPGIEDLGVNDLGGQATDLGSWLQDFDEDVNLHQGDYVMGLEVPMDDLADLGMML